MLKEGRSNNMAIKVRVEGVGILSFPDGTSRDVISDTVRRYASEKAPATIAEMRRREEQPGFNPTQAQKMGAAMQAEEERLAEAGAPSAFDEEAPAKLNPKTALRYGVPLAVALGTGGASIPIQIAAGAGSSLAGEAGAQTIEKLDEDQDYRLGEIAGATIRGGIPVFRGFPGATRATITAGGLGGLAAGAVEGKIENPLEDPLSSAGSALKETAIGAAIPGALATLGAGARAGAGAINRAIENAQDVERIGPGVRATVGQAFPFLAGAEKRIAARTGGEDLNRQLLEQSDAITAAVRGLQGQAGTSESVIGKILNQFGITDPNTVSRIADESKGLISAEQAVVNARTAAQRSLAQEALQDAESAFRRVINKEQQILNAVPFESAKMGKAIENTFDQTKKAIQDHSDILYTPVRFFENDKVFNLGLKSGKNTTSVEQAILDLKKNHPYLQSGDENRRFIPYLDDLNSVLENQSPSSLSQLRAIRQKLYDASSSSDPIVSKAKKDLRDIADKITQSIDYQGSYLLKPANYQSLKTANKFWSEFTPQLDNFGVSQAFKEGSEELGQMAELYTGRVSQQGAEAPAFKNAVQLLSDLRKVGVRNVPDPQGLNEIVKSGIIENSINKTTQQLDLSSLAANLNKIERTSPGSLSQLGFGNTTELNRFVSFIERLPAAQQQGPEAVLALLQNGTPASLRFLSSAVNQLPDVATTRTVMNALERRAVAGSSSALATQTAIRAKAIEELLLQVAEGGGTRAGTPGASGMAARLDSLKEMAGTDSAAKLQTILGRNLFDVVQNQIVPGFRVINQAKQRAAGAGATVSGSAFEKLATTPGIGSMVDFIGYEGLAAALAHGAGATGMVRRRDQLERLARLAELPPALMQQTVAKYTLADSSE
jgi:hypothetical protein